MNKVQALDSFWNSFGWDAYDETSVPDNASLPYITYEVSTDSFNESVPLSASLWMQSNSWKDITLKEMEIAEAIGRGGKMVAYEGGAFWVTKGSPWSYRVQGENKQTRRITLNILVEFID